MFVFALLFATASLFAQNEGFSKVTKKLEKAVHSFKYKPEEKNLQKLEDTFQKSLKSDPAQEHYMWRLMGEAFYFVNVKEKRDFGKAFEYYTKALEMVPESLPAERSVCLYNLGLMYLRGHHVERNLEKAVELFTESSKEGYLPADVAMAKMYNFGLGVEKDFAKADEFYLKLIEQGHNVFSERYSMLYVQANADAPDDVEANNLFEKALVGLFLEESEEVIFKDLMKASDMGHAAAKTTLAELRLAGKFISESSLDLGVAEQLTQNASAKGYVHGIFVQAQIIERSTWGKMFQWDRAKQYWNLYQKAAELGHPLSQCAVGVVYSGEAPPVLSLLKMKPDKEKAYEWFSKAAEQGWPTAKNKALQYKSYAK